MPDAIAASVGGAVINALVYDLPQVIAISLAPVSPVAFPNANTVVVLTATTNCWFTVGGTAAKATAGSDYLAAGTKWMLKIPAGQALSFIADSAAGYVSITPALPPAAPAVALLNIPAAAQVFDFTTGVLDASITFTRTTTGPYFDNTGTLQTAAINAARFDYDPVALTPRGLLIEEARTNSIRNNTMVGAVAGTPGTLPTNWTQSTNTGCSLNVVGTGTENGIAYVDLRIFGTATGGGNFNFLTDANNNAAATPGQIWTGSCYMKLVGGSLTNISSLSMGLQFFNAALTIVQGTGLPGIMPSAANLAVQRFVTNPQTAPATTAWTRLSLNINTAAAGATDVTIRFGLPQLELGAFATSPIATSTVAVTRAVDNASAPLGGWYNQNTGTFDAEYIYEAIGTGQQTAIQLDNNSSDRMLIFRGTGSNQIVATCIIGGAGQFSFNAPQQTVALQLYKVAFAVDAVNGNNFAVSGAIVGSGLGAHPTTQTFLRLGAQGAGAAQPLNGWLRRFTYYNTALTPAQLQALTVY